MEKQLPDEKLIRARQIVKLARAIYDAADSEDEKEWLDHYAEVASAVSKLFSAASKASLIESDLIIDLQEFVALKKGGVNAGYSEHVRGEIETLEKEYGIVVK